MIRVIATMAKFEAALYTLESRQPESRQLNGEQS
jgi:hypothetical protein